jgi:DNA-binding NtrC family response regulator
MEDLPLLSRHFLQQFNQEFGGQVRGFSSAAEWALLNYRWPGNVRELENVIGRACLLADGPHIEVQDLSIAYTNSGSWSEHLGGGAARPDRSPTSAVGKKAVRSAIIQK